MSTSTPALYAALVDDAAIFPPGNAALPVSLAQHRSHRDAWYAGVVGPLLVSDVRLGELARLLATDPTDEPVGDLRGSHRRRRRRGPQPASGDDVDVGVLASLKSSCRRS